MTASSEYQRLLELLASQGGKLTQEQLDAELAKIRDSDTLPTLELPGRPSAAESPSPAPRRPASQDRFLVIRAHAKGGLGQVSIALDRELNRHVALKEILSHRAGDVESQHRFVQEAEITGQLEHPGIVPIYGLGAYPDGRPYYAMRFVEGENLKRAIERFHATRKPHEPLAGQRAIEFRQLLGRFVDVCNAVEYAHSRRVLHRDLKPENILLGPYGETLVVDWGLAKPLDAREANAAIADDASDDPGVTRPIRIRSGGSSESIDGAAMGTPAYMSPEQAHGKIQELGPATDVYSLGATLYALLTGKPPVSGHSVMDTLEKVRRNDIPRPRDAWPAVPRALEAVCLRAIAADPAQRYSSAKALADDVEKWLADEPVDAYTEPLPARVKRWIRRNPVLVSTTAACSAIGLAAALLVAYLQGAHALEVEEKNHTISRQLVELSNKNQTIETKNIALASANEKEALARREAEIKRDHAESVTDFLVKSFRKARPDQDGKSLTVYDALLRSLREIDEVQGLNPINKAEILDAMRASFLGLGMPVEEYEAARRALEIFTRESGPNHPDTLSAQNNAALALRNLGRFPEAIALMEQTVKQHEALSGSDQLETLRTKINLAGTYRAAGKLDLALPLFESAGEAFRRRLGESHPEVLVTQNNLASAYKSAGQLSRAIELFQKTLEIQKATLGPNHPSTLTTQGNLASTYDVAGDYDRAIPLLESTLEAMRAKLGVDHLDTLVVQNNLARAYQIIGRVEEAIPLYEAIVESETRQLGANHPSVLQSLGNLASAYEALGDYNKSLPIFESNFQRLKEILGPEHPSTLIAQNDLASAYQTQGRLEEAVGLLQSALEIRKRTLGDDHPDTLTSKNNLASAYQDEDRFDLAIPLLEEALDGLKRVYSDDHPFTLSTQNNLAMAYRAAGQAETALELHEKTYAALRQKLGDDHPSTLASGGNLALTLVALRRLDEAISHMQRLLELNRQRYGALDPHAMTAQQTLLFTMLEANRIDDAKTLLEDYLQKTREVADGDGSIWRLAAMPLARELFETKQFDLAEPVMGEIAEICRRNEPDSWTTYIAVLNLARVRLAQRNFAGASPLLSEADEGIQKCFAELSEAERSAVIDHFQKTADLCFALGAESLAQAWEQKAEALRKVPPPSKNP